MAASAAAVVMPDEAKKRANFLYQNGFGVQSPGEQSIKDAYVLCMCSADTLNDEALWQRVLGESKSITASRGSWVGRDYVKIHWSEYESHGEAVIDALLRNSSVPFTLCNRPETCLDPKLDTPVVGVRWRWADQESALIRKITQWQKLGIPFNKDLIHEVLTDPWNWTTPAGKAFCVDLRRAMYLPDMSEAGARNHPDNYWNWKIFAGAASPALAAAAAASQKQPDVAEEDLRCHVCLDKTPNTLVLPCGHNVVCSDCSKQLAHTNDKATCVRCRQDIHEVIYP
jgi:hypothetical protein